MLFLDVFESQNFAFIKIWEFAFALLFFFFFKHLVGSCPASKNWCSACGLKTQNACLYANGQRVVCCICHLASDKTLVDKFIQFIVVGSCKSLYALWRSVKRDRTDCLVGILSVLFGFVNIKFLRGKVATIMRNNKILCLCLCFWRNTSGVCSYVCYKSRFPFTAKFNPFIQGLCAFGCLRNAQPNFIESVLLHS